MPQVVERCKRAPSAKVLARREHPSVIPYEQLSTLRPKCNLQLTLWDGGSACIETNDGSRYWFDVLVKYCAFVQRNKDRHACVCYKRREREKGSGGSMDVFALFVDEVAFTPPIMEEKYKDPKHETGKSRMLGERKNAQAARCGKDLHCSNNNASLRGKQFWDSL